jgi:hypothetical protein
MVVAIWKSQESELGKLSLQTKQPASGPRPVYLRISFFSGFTMCLVHICTELGSR